ncbi:MAG: protein kinase [Sandaracinus sp.]
MPSDRTGPLSPAPEAGLGSQQALDATVPDPAQPPGPAATPSRQPALRPWPPFGPARIGRYEILSEIASGGMGRVFLGRARGPLGFEKLVAIKTIHSELAREQAFVDMFFDEARIAARIDHENVCRVFDFGQADGQYFLAMEYLVGVNLGRVLRALVASGAHRDFDLIAAHIVAQAAEGLHAAHELTDEHGRALGVVHRDVSPQNIFLTFDGGVRVVDFGIASAEGRRHQTATGGLKGKLGYMAPEQLRREKADRRADVWALGVVLWELLTWERAFRGGNEVETVLAVLNDPVRPPRTVRASIDPELETIVMSALQKDRDQRLGDARSLAGALRAHVVRRGAVVGPAELAAFLADVVPDDRREALELVDEARRTPAVPSIAPPAPAPPVAPTAAPVAETARTDAARGESADERRSHERSPEATNVGARRPFGLWAGAALTTMVVLGIGLRLATSTPVTMIAPTTSAPPATGGAPATSRTTSAATSASPTSAVGDTSIATAAPEGAPSSAAPAEGASTPTTTGTEPPATAPPPSSHPTSSHRRPRPAPVDATSGVLVVTTPGGWADVYADGRRLGRTPLTTQLPAGAAQLTLRPFTIDYPDDARLHPHVTIGSRITQITVPLGSDGRPR